MKTLRLMLKIHPNFMLITLFASIALIFLIKNIWADVVFLLTALACIMWCVCFVCEYEINGEKE